MAGLNYTDDSISGYASSRQVATKNLLASLRSPFLLIREQLNAVHSIKSYLCPVLHLLAPIKIAPYSEQKIIHMQNGLSVASAYGQLSLNEITNRRKAISIYLATKLQMNKFISIAYLKVSRHHVHTQVRVSV